MLIDCGLSGKELKRRLAGASLDPSRLEAVIISHEHRDHALGAGVVARMFDLPVYLNQRTYQVISEHLGRVNPRFFQTGREFDVSGLTIHPFSISHDAIDPVGFALEHDGRKLGLATDLGVVTQLVKNHLTGCHGLILEANHDYRMLMEGPYPWDLKVRVRGRRGHLNNEDTAELMELLNHTDLSSVVLAHLSETNNLPELALDRVRSVFGKPSFSLTAADQYEPGDPVDL